MYRYILFLVVILFVFVGAIYLYSNRPMDDGVSTPNNNVSQETHENAQLLGELKKLYMSDDCVGVIKKGQSAAQNGNARAQLYLAKCYEASIQEQGHKEKALYWYKRSVAGGDDLACAYLGMLYMGFAIRDQDEQLATDACTLFKCAADAGNEIGTNYHNAYSCEK